MTPDWAVVNFCKKHGIFYQSFSTLGRQYIARQLMDDPDTQSPVLSHKNVQLVAESQSREPAQVVLRWAVQAGIGVIPKSAREARIESNKRLFDFELSTSEMELIDALQKVDVTFQNMASDTMSILWSETGETDTNAKLHHNMDLKPGEEGTLHSFAGHVFIVKQGDAIHSVHEMAQRNYKIEIHDRQDL